MDRAVLPLELEIDQPVTLPAAPPERRATRTTPRSVQAEAVIRQGLAEPVAAVEAGGGGEAGQDALGPGVRESLFGVELGDAVFVGRDVGALGGQVVGFVVEDRRLREARFDAGVLARIRMSDNESEDREDLFGQFQFRRNLFRVVADRTDVDGAEAEDSAATTAFCAARAASMKPT